MQRTAKTTRTTRETDISMQLTLDGPAAVEVATGLAFMDHMLTAFARHGHFGLVVKGTGDLDVDAHHTVEDLGLVLGQTLREAVGDKKGIRRFGSAVVPMDDALARVAIDLCGRPHLGYRVTGDDGVVGGVRGRLFKEFFQALANSAAAALHVDLLAGNEIHHIFEAIFKACGRALDEATQLDSRCADVPSTKGMLE